MRKRIIPFALVVFFGAGCEEMQQPRDYWGSVTVHKTNGRVTSINVYLTGQTNAVTVRNRLDTMALIAQLESTITDLKAASDQFPVDEKKQEGQQKSEK